MDALARNPLARLKLSAVDRLDAVVERIVRPRQRDHTDDLRYRGRICLVSRHALVFSAYRLASAKLTRGPDQQRKL
jgi:hypothetical protein